MLIPRDPCEQCVDVVGQATAAPADILVRPNEGEAAPVALARLWKFEVEYAERDRARRGGALQRRGIGLGIETQQRKARTEAVEQRASHQPLLIEPKVR